MQAECHGGAVACTVEKSASGQKSAGSETQQEKGVVTHGKNREKAVPAAEFATDKVVVENNSLSKDKPPVNIYDINPLKPNALDADGDPLKGGGGIGKFTINKGQQNKHLPGTNEYKIASEAGLNKSVLTVAPDSLLPKLGTGQQVGNTPVGVPGSKERINYGQNIGNYIDPQTGVSTPTTNGIVHYGKNGVHIVPARPSE
ncbi:MAG TPA: polymorphic toxin type 50 domain-containing protein [Klebsiella sp.]